ncbi:MAG: hypothetical protein ACI4TZ_04255 [Christensenellales bacterium]
MKGKDKKSKKLTFNKMIWTADAVVITLFVGLAGSVAVNRVVADNRVKGVDSQLVCRTDFGAPVYANLGKDKNLDVIIDESFNDTQKQNIKNAIEELDVDLKGVNYNILLDSDKAGKKCINITNQYYTDDSNAIAFTEMDINNIYGNVIFPVQISIFSDKYDSIYDDPNFDKKYMSATVKHEMLHVLGFKDVYDSEYQNKTIMYGELNSRTKLFDLSQADKDMVNTVYKPITKDINVRVDTYAPFYKPMNFNINAEEDLSM